MLNGIAFNKSELFDHIHSRKPFSICYTIEENKHHGMADNIQLLIKEIHLDEK